MPDHQVISVLDVRFLNITMDQALALLDDTVSNGRKEAVSFINADCLNISVHDTEYRELLNTQNIVLPDGAGIGIACRLIGEKMAANLNGTDLLPPLCELARQRDYKMFLLGAAEGVGQRMKANLESTYPGLDIVGEQHGYFDHDSDTDKVLDSINALKPNIILVAFGAPRQEKWIRQHIDRLDANLLLGVGGLFDFYSGDKKRAPLWMRNNGLEWMYRLYLEPGRLWRRYIIGNPLFVYRMVRWIRKRKK
jgi:N-acetylglucosaminyldiphosphoundecaprenol N-acetyl-beta-D-mannosaminyltransferase